MDLKDQVIQEYLNSGCGFRKQALEYNKIAKATKKKPIKKKK